MSAATSHPLAAAYLRDLELLLHGLDPGARAEVLAGVREHLSDALGPDADGNQVQAALSELGSPQSIADEAYAGQRAAVPVVAPAPSRWQAVVACALNGAGLAYLLLLSWAGVSGIDFLGVVPLFLLPWVGVVALTTVSRVWSPRQKATSIVFGPALLLCLALLGAALLATIGPSPVNAIPILAIFGSSAWILVLLVRQALR
jgi:uncharacterized membrane protein